MRCLNKGLPFFALLCILQAFLPGCSENAETIAKLEEDRRERIERGAIERLRERGCLLQEIEDEWLGTSGLLLTLSPEHFNADGLILDEVVTEFQHILNLFLVVDQTPISSRGLQQLRTLNNLRLLSAQLTNTDTSGLFQIEGIVSLKLLRLNWTRLEDDSLVHIRRLSDLVMLYLSGTGITDDGLVHLLPLRKLRALQLSHTRISNAGINQLAELSELEYLSLNHTGLTDECLTALSRLKKLRYLNLSGTKVTPEGLREFSRLLPECRLVLESIDRAGRADTPGASRDRE
jgi:hypothetical protein